MVNNATNKFTKIFKYFVDCFMLLLLVPAIPYILLLFLARSCHSLHLVTIPYTFLPFLALYPIRRLQFLYLGIISFLLFSLD